MLQCMWLFVAIVNVASASVPPLSAADTVVTKCASSSDLTSTGTSACSSAFPSPLVALDAWLDRFGVAASRRVDSLHFPGMGFGLGAREDLAVGDIALRVPLRLIVHDHTMRRRLDALKLGKWEHDEDLYTVFWLREAVVERAASFYAPLLRVMLSYQHCPEEEDEEHAGADEASFLRAPDGEQPWWSWVRADGIRAECSHVIYWSDADLARLPAAGMRRRVLNLRRTIAERFESMRARRVLARAGLADVTLRDFSWAHLLGSSRTWSFERLRRVPPPLNKLRALRRASAFAALKARGAAGTVTGGSAVIDRAEEERLLGPAPWDEHDEREGRVATAEGEYVFVPGLDLFNHRQRSSIYDGVAAGGPVAHVQIRVSDDGLYAEALVVGAARKGEQVSLKFCVDAILF